MGTTVGGLVYPENSDAPAGPQQMKALADAADPKIVRRFTSSADRAAQVPSPQDGEVTYLSDVDRLEVRAGGVYVRLTVPADLTLLTNPPACHLYRAAALSLNGTTSAVPIVWTESARDTHGMFTDNSSRVTATVAGLYHVRVRPGFGNYAAPIKYLSVRKNSAGSNAGGTELFTVVFDTGTSGSSASLPPVYADFDEPFTIGDYFEAFVYQNSGGVITGGLSGGQTATFVQARRVSA